MQLTNDDLNFVNTVEGTSDPKLYYGQATPVGASEPWASMPVGSLWLKTTGSNVTMYFKVADADADADWTVVSSPNRAIGFIDMPINGGWREVASNDIPDAAVGVADSSGGILAKDTTPNLEFTNGDTDSALRLQWAASNSDAIAGQFTLPPDLDRAQPITLKVYGAVTKAGGAVVDNPTFTVESFFDKDDTKVADTSAAITSETPATVSTTIAAADIPDAGVTWSVEITPAAHTTDSLEVYAIWAEYTRK